MSEFLKFLGEKLTFDRLFKLSEPERVKRADTVRGPPLEIDAHSDSQRYRRDIRNWLRRTAASTSVWCKAQKKKQKMNRATEQQTA